MRMKPKRHVHQWRELLKRGRYERTTFVICDRCAEEEREEAVKYLGRQATAEFRYQVKHGIRPRFVSGGLVPVREQR